MAIWALLHLELLVANLVFCFEWKPFVGNYDQEFTGGMKIHLLAGISPIVKLLEPCSSKLT